MKDNRFSGNKHSLMAQYKAIGQYLLRIILVFATVITINHPLKANSDDPPGSVDTSRISMRYDLSEIEVHARLAPVIFREAARVITVITRQEIRQLPANSLPELLEHIAGVDVRQRGPEGMQADISVRGGTFDQYVILLNGINITDPQTGHHNLNLPVNFEQIDRIEVLEGSAARVHGPNAFSGAINIITTLPSETSALLNFSYGSHDLKDLYTAFSLKTGSVSQSLSFGQKSSDGYISNTDFNHNNLFYTLTSGFSGGKIDFHTGYSQKSFGANSFYTPVYPDQYESTRALLMSLKWETSTPFHLTPSIYWRRHHDRFELFRNEKPGWYTTHNYHLTDVFGINANTWFISRLGKTSAGAEMRSETILSNVLGEKLNTPVKVPGEDAWFAKFKSRNGFSFFLEHSYKWNNLELSGGILMHKFSDFPLKWKIYPGAEITYNTSNQSRIFVSGGKSLRMPTFTDLYYNGPNNQGNPELRPEENQSFEAGWKFNGETISGSLSWYNQVGNDLIDWIKYPEETKWRTSNLTKISNSGIQIYFRWIPKEGSGISIFVTEMSGGMVKNFTSKHEADFISYYVLDQLSHKVTFRASHLIARNFTATWSINIQDRNGTYTAYLDGVKGNETPYPSYWLADGKIIYRLGNIELWVSASNIFDKSYFDLGNVLQPGRWMKAGIALHTRTNERKRR